MSELLFTIRNASWKSWWETLLWVGYDLLGSLMPIWGTYFLLKLHPQQFHLNDGKDSACLRAKLFRFCVKS